MQIDASHITGLAPGKDVGTVKVTAIVPESAVAALNPKLGEYVGTMRAAAAQSDAAESGVAAICEVARLTK